MKELERWIKRDTQGESANTRMRSWANSKNYRCYSAWWINLFSMKKSSIWYGGWISVNGKRYAHRYRGTHKQKYVPSYLFGVSHKLEVKM